MSKGARLSLVDDIFEVITSTEIPESDIANAGGDGITQRIEALSKNMEDIKAALKEIQAGQQSLSIRAAEQAGDAKLLLASMDVKFLEIKSGFSGLDTKFLESISCIGNVQTQLDGKISNLKMQSDGLRQTVEKLPSEWAVAMVLVYVIAILASAAVLIKNAWPLLSKMFGP